MQSIRIVCSLVTVAACAAGQNLPDLPRLKNFSAHRVSSANRFTGSNDDSKRIMPGETYVMADLRGPGVVSHIWLTVADNEYAWPRLVRLRVYYDGKKTPSIDAPLGDFFGVGHGYDRNLDSMMIRNKWEPSQRLFVRAPKSELLHIQRLLQPRDHLGLPVLHLRRAPARSCRGRRLRS